MYLFRHFFFAEKLSNELKIPFVLLSGTPSDGDYSLVEYQLPQYWPTVRLADKQKREI